jgi:hypothetical protein
VKVFGSSKRGHAQPEYAPQYVYQHHGNNIGLTVDPQKLPQ